MLNNESNNIKIIFIKLNAMVADIDVFQIVLQLAQC